MWARTEWSSDPFGLLLRCLTPLTLLFPFRSQYRQGGWRLTDTDSAGPLTTEIRNTGPSKTRGVTF